MKKPLTGPFTRGKELIDASEDEIEDFYTGRSGLIQNAFPHLSADVREFILTGITPAEWDSLFDENE